MGHFCEQDQKEARFQLSSGIQEGELPCLLSSCPLPCPPTRGASPSSECPHPNPASSHSSVLTGQGRRRLGPNAVLTCESPSCSWPQFLDLSLTDGQFKA